MERLARPFQGLPSGVFWGGVICSVLAFAAIAVVVRGAGVPPGDGPVSLSILLASYALPSLILMMWLGRKAGLEPHSVIGSLPQARSDAAIAARRCLACLSAILVLTVLAVSLLGEVVTPPPEEAGTTRPFVSWLTLLPVAAVAVLLQSGSEEVLFRGFLQPVLRARSDNPLVWLGGSAALFGLAHVPFVQSGQEAAYMFFYTFLLGLVLGDLTARTGSIGAAVGLHWAWNVWQFVLFGEQDAPMSGYALFLHRPVQDAPFTVLTAFAIGLTVAIPWLAIRIGLRR